MNHKLYLPLLSLFVGGCLFGFLALFATPFALAHELAPFLPPVGAACYVAATTCEAVEPQQPTHADLHSRAQLTPTRPADGKSWLREPDALISGGAIRAANRDPIYNAPCQNGFADIFPCSQVDLLAFLPHTLIGGDTNNDMWGWTDPETGKEYALVGARDGVAFVDISTPSVPRFLGKLPTHATRSSWRDLKVYQNHLFVVADRNYPHGMQVFDLTQLRTLSVSATATPTLLFSESAHYSGFSDAHNLAINEESGYAYAVGGESCNSGLHMINIADVNAPQNAGCYSEDGYIHDTQCVIYRGPDEGYLGRELCFNSSVSLFTIVDVTDKSAPTRLSTIAVNGNIYMHQGWLTPDQHYFLLNDEMDEWFGQHNTRTYIFDVSDIDAPRFVDAYTAALPSVDHNLYISGTYAYEANYTSGLRILDLKNLTDGELTETGYFDTYPENDAAINAGAWTAFPFYSSGVVAISTIDRGLFLVKPHLSPDLLLIDPPAVVAHCSTLSPQGQLNLTVDLLARNGYAQSARLRAIDLPPAATVTFTPAQVALQGTTHATSTLQVNVTALAGGAYTFTIEAVDANEVVLDQAVVKFHLAGAPAAAPLLQAPTMTTVDRVAGLPFTWSSDGSATDYLVEIATDADFAAVVYTATVSTTALSVTDRLTYDQSYFWRVQPRNGCGAGERSAVGQFRTPVGLFMPLIRR